MADVITDKTQVSATIEAIVSVQIQEVLTAKMVIPPAIMDLSEQVGPGMDRVKIPRYGNFTVVDKAASTALEVQSNAFATDDLLLDKHQAVPFLVEDIADLQSKVNVTQAYIMQAGKDLAAKMDLNLITAMVAAPSAAAPDHIIQFANSPTNTLGKSDVLNARELLGVQNVDMDDRSMLVNPLREKELLSISEFTRVDESGSQGALRNGEIGKLFGFSVLMSAQAPSTDVLFFHKSCHAFARQLAPRVQQDKDLRHLGQLWVIDHIWGNKSLDLGKRSVKVNATGA